MKRSVYGSIILVISLGGAVACSSTSSSSTSSAAVAASTSASPQFTCEAGMTPDANGVCQFTATPTTAPPTTSSPAPPPTTSAPPAMTASEQQAVDAAQQYLSDGQGFSEAGLLNQLTSQYGSGFPTADAQFAIDYLHPDWYAQAYEAAQGYMAMGGFSRQSLLDQLTSPYGGQFTYRQALYAVNRVGL